jgi:hypothetical protein
MRYVFAATDAEFNRIFNDTAEIVEFANDAEEQAYVASDEQLIQLIKDAVDRELGLVNCAHVHHIEDWWPNHTRYVECNLAVFDETLRSALQSLLHGEYEPWRIQIVVYRDMMLGATQVGSMVLNAGWTLVDRRLYDELRTSGKIA